MKKIRFYGHSDDIVVIDNDKFSDEFGVKFDTGQATFKVEGSSGRLGVLAEYDPPGAAGTWAFGIFQIDEDDPLPPWTIRFEKEHLYSHALVIECPDDGDVEVRPLNVDG